jgi:hypothetical protein
MGPVRPVSRRLSPPDGRHHGIDAEDVDGPPEIVGERSQAELGPDIVEAPHQESALIHPLLDAAEGVLDGLTAPREDVRPGLQAARHPVQHGLVPQPRDPATVGGAPRSERTDGARRRIAVIDLFQIAQLALVVRRQGFSGRTDEDIPGRIVAELLLGEEALARRRSALRLGDMGREPRLLAGLDVLDLEVTPIGDDIDALDVEDGAGRPAVCVSRPMSTTWLVTACSTIILCFASTATCAL